MSKKSYRQAINEALAQEMRRDPNVVILGIDMGGGQGGSGAIGDVGGVLGVTRGLYAEFGATRVIDTPISESAIMGAAAGAALTGLRPVAELMFVDFLGVCLDQVYNQAAKFRYMFGGKAKTPMVIRTMIGAGLRAGAQHSQTLHPWLTAVPGLKVVMPSNAYDAKGLLIEAIRDDDPVVFLESKVLYDTEDEVPDEMYRIPFGEANIVRAGRDVTIVALGAMVPRALQAAQNLQRAGISVELIDPRTTSPLDSATILESVEKTGRLVIVDESPPRCSLAADIAAVVAEEGFHFLRGPIRRVTCPHTPVPFAPNLEDAYVPSVAAIEAAAQSLAERSHTASPDRQTAERRLEPALKV
jgi:acetoin:2,6-dichlorophenolindophenol oxidoreductase subunit beta